MLRSRDRQEAKDQIRVALGSWPEVPPEVATWLQGLHWRIRQEVVLHLALGHSQEETGVRMRVSPAAVQRDISRACETWIAADLGRTVPQVCRCAAKVTETAQSAA